MSRVARVCELAEQLRGVSYGKSDASSSPRPGYLPVLRAGNITEDGLTFDDLVFVPAERISAGQKIRRNDVVIAASSGSLNVVGKAARALHDYEGGFGAFCRVLRPGADVDPTYFAHFFRTQLYRQKVSTLSTGVNINNLRNEHLNEIQIPLPPLPEQRRIAEILEKVDTLRANRRAALAHLDNLTQSIFLDMFGDPATNPYDICKLPLGDLIKLKSGDFLPATEMADSGPYSVLGGNGITGHHDQYMFEDPQIVIGRVGVYCGCVHASPPKSWVTDNALYVKEQSPRLRFVYLQHALMHARLNQYASQSGQPLVSGSRIYPVSILVPPEELQITFEVRIASMNNLKRLYDDTNSKVNILLAALQHRAFQGKL